MKKIVWSKTYEVGIAEIDEQHKKFIEIINRLFESKGTDTESSSIGKALTDIVDYTNFHFDSEEKHMQGNTYDRLYEHQGQHKILKKQLVKILEDLKFGKLKVGEDLLEILQNWLIRHILQHDKEYSHFLRSTG